MIDLTYLAHVIRNHIALGGSVGEHDKLGIRGFAVDLSTCRYLSLEAIIMYTIDANSCRSGLTREVSFTVWISLTADS